ncbi:MAG: hypothetical protein AAFU03_14300 [Bacteroidota bacterium]
MQIRTAEVQLSKSSTVGSLTGQGSVEFDTEIISVVSLVQNWEIGYPKDDHNIQRVGVNIRESNVTSNGVSFTVDLTFKDKDHDFELTGTAKVVVIGYVQ